MRVRSTWPIGVWLALNSIAFSGTIDKLVLQPTADSVRVQAAFRNNEAIIGAQVAARISACGDGTLLWQGSLGSIDIAADSSTPFEKTISGLAPQLWSPGSPTLYELTLTLEHAGQILASQTVRTGFRSVESRDGQILLNGKPVFLCGLAINPPGRGVPESAGLSKQFAYDYVKFMRSQHFNCIRMNLEFVVDPRAQYWFDACDELGMMVYQGDYGSPPVGEGDKLSGKDGPPKDLDASVAGYQRVFETYSRHPAVIIYILSNELPYTGTRGKAWHDFLTAAYEKLKPWDSTRLYIGNAGYGEGKEGDINDVHRYWGWYYNSFLTYYNLRRSHEIFGTKGAVQPFTFSECVGTFTSTLGEINMTYRKQIGAQLHWTGHSPDQSADALAYQAFIAKHACESFRTMRESNPRLAGLMPFTILYFNWDGIERFDQMKPKPVVDAMATAYQPVLLSWELWTPQVYAGSVIEPWAHVVNDAEDFSALRDAKLVWELSNAEGKVAVSGEQVMPTVDYFAHAKAQLTIKLPGELATGDYTLVGRLLSGNQCVSTNRVPVFIAGDEWRKSFAATKHDTAPLLYDPSGKTADALRRLGIDAEPVTDLTTLTVDRPLIVGENAAPPDDIATLATNGARVLLLAQDAARFKPSWLPAKVEMLAPSANDPEYLHRQRPSRDQMHINIERPEHPIFAGLNRARLRLWSDYTGWNQAKPGFPAVYPVTCGFRLTDAADLARTAVLANYDRGLEGVAVCEMFDGSGSIVFTGLDLVNRIGLDPAADRMLANLVAYLSVNERTIYPLVDEPIEWGRYATERGVVCGPLNGLVVNCRWVAPPTDPNAKPLPDNEGAWNVLPGHQYVPVGRRIIGPYAYSSATSIREDDKDSRTGTGAFHVALRPGCKVMATTIENPSKQDASLQITVNGIEETFTIPAAKTTSVRSPLPPRSHSVSVRYAGPKDLILRQTAFE